MRNLSFLSLPVAIAACLLAAISLSGNAQNPAQGGPGYGAGMKAKEYKVAVVDISYIFKQHQRFQTMMDAMKREVDSARGTMQQTGREIEAMTAKLKQFNPGTPDFKRLDEEIAKKKADGSLQAQKQRKEFLNREAKIYHQTYLEVYDAIKLYAQRNDIATVLRFNGEPVEEIDPNRSQDVMRTINRTVVFQNAIDITPYILEDLNRSARPAAAVPNNINQIPGRPGARR